MYKRVVLDEYMDRDGERTSYHTGEQFCDIYYGRGTKRVRVVEEETMPVDKRAYIEKDQDYRDEIQVRLTHKRRQYTAIQTQ